jgi:hypothetical protein
MHRSPKALHRAFAPPRSYSTRRRMLTAALVAGIVVLGGLLTTRSSAVAAGCNFNASPGSFASAVSAAAPGQTICLATGDYGTWRGTNKAIIVQAAAGASPTMQITFGSGASSFTLSGMHGMGGSISGSASAITVQNSVFSSELSIDGGSGIRINQNDFSYPVQSTNGGPNAKVYLDTSGGAPGSAVTVENNSIENGDLDGVHIAGGSGMLILGNVFANLCDRGVNHTDNIQFEAGSQVRIADNYVYEAQNCPTQGITAYDGNTNGLLIDDNVVDVPRDWGIELYSDHNSTVVHNTVVWHPNSYSEFNTPTGQIDIDRKSQDPAGSGTQVYDNIGEVDFTNGSTGTAHNNVSGQRAAYVGPTNSWAGFKLAANSPVGLKAASDGLDDGVRVTAAPGSPIPPGGSAPNGGKKPAPSKGGGKGASKRTAGGLTVTRFQFSPSSFHARGGHAARDRHRTRGTMMMFHLSRRATVKVTIARALRGRRAGRRCVTPKRALRGHAGCIRFRREGTLVYRLRGGSHAIPYRGRMHGHRLKPGAYLATIVARSGKHHSSLRAATFEVL